MSKINWLVTHTLPGSVIVQQWLTDNGIRYSLAQKYTQSGWLKKFGSGVYYRPGANDGIKPGWADALMALDTQLHMPVHVAGLSSLTHQGLSHYLHLGKEQIWIGVKKKQILPKWFREFAWQDWHYCGNHKLQLIPETDFKMVNVKGKVLKLSCPELAAFEVVDAIGKSISFEHAAELFQGLVNLSPRKVQSILERSRSIQANRIFLFLGQHFEHQWMNRINETSIELGSGKRQVVKNGRLDDKYKITVPETFAVTKSKLHHGYQ